MQKEHANQIKAGKKENPGPKTHISRKIRKKRDQIFKPYLNDQPWPK